MKLTTEQQEKAVGLRLLLRSDPPESEVGWEAYQDFTRSLAQMLDGLDTFVRPTEIKGVMDRAWKSFCSVWIEENRRIVLEAIGGDEALLDQVRSHPNGRKMCSQILDRVREQAEMTFGMNVAGMDVTDILAEGMENEYN